MFIYVASLASNEPFRFSLMGTLLIFVSLGATPVLWAMDGLILSPKIVLQGSGVNRGPRVAELIRTIYDVPAAGFTLYVVMYLLLTLFAVVKITGSYFGPLRLMPN